MKFDWLSVFTNLQVLNEEGDDTIKVASPFSFINHLWDNKDEDSNKNDEA